MDFVQSVLLPFLKVRQKTFAYRLVRCREKFSLMVAGSAFEIFLQDIERLLEQNQIFRVRKRDSIPRWSRNC